MIRPGQRRWLILCWAMTLVIAVPASAIVIQLDYSYDTGNFFAPGSQARASIEAAATFFSDILADTFSAIQTPNTFVGSSGSVTWQWTMNFTNPANNNPVVRTNPIVNADQYIVFAGARNLSGNTLGVGGPGGYTWSSNPTGTFTSAEISQINQITANFEDAVERRGETSGFARWGGAITFDSAPPAPWHYNHTTVPSGTVTDFYSVAIHELAHALGFGEDDTDGSNFTAWESFVSSGDSRFYGSNATAAYGGPVPLQPAPDLSHWAEGTTSVVYGTSVPQEAAMDPTLTTGTRKRFTALDAAAMKDIGWTVVSLPANYGDYNNNGVVDAADFAIWRKRLGQSVMIPNDSTPGMVSSSDYTVWRNNFGDTLFGGAGASVSSAPEPSGLMLIFAACAAAPFARRKRRG